MPSRNPLAFFADEDVADSVGTAIQYAGHQVTRLRDAMLTGSADSVVATACREGGLILITHNYRDFRRISSKFELTKRQFERLHRIELGCSQAIAARRIVEEMAIIELEWARRTSGPSRGGMRIFVGDYVVKIERVKPE